MAKKQNFISILLTIVVVSLLVIAGPASALDVTASLSDTTPVAQDSITISGELQLQSGERIPLNQITFTVTNGTTVAHCIVDIMGTPISGCSDFSNITITSGVSHTQGYGYGYGYGAFGYGYGYTGAGNIAYSAAYQTPADAGTYTITVSAKAGSATWSSPAQSFTSSAIVENVEVSASNISSLISNGTFDIDGSNAQSTQNITVTDNVTINLGNSSVFLPVGTVIRAADGSPINASAIAMSTISASVVANLPVSGEITGVLAWGITGVTLTFDPAITIEISVGTARNGQTLRIYRSPSETSGWTTDGLTSATCVVSNGICSFQTTKASYFATTTVTSSTATTSSSSSSGNGPYIPSQNKYVAPAKETVADPSVAPSVSEESAVAPSQTAQPTTQETSTASAPGLTGNVVANKVSPFGVIVGLLSVLVIGGFVIRSIRKPKQPQF